jgi:hypothetical protein
MNIETVKQIIRGFDDIKGEFIVELLENQYEEFDESLKQEWIKYNGLINPEILEKNVRGWQYNFPNDDDLKETYIIVKISDKFNVYKSPTIVEHMGYWQKEYYKIIQQLNAIINKEFHHEKYDKK